MLLKISFYLELKLVIEHSLASVPVGFNSMDAVTLVSAECRLLS